MNGLKRVFEFFNLFLGMLFLGTSVLLFKTGMDEQSVVLQAISVALLLVTLLTMLRARWHRVVCRDCNRMLDPSVVRFRARDTKLFIQSIADLSTVRLQNWYPAECGNDMLLKIQLCAGCSANALLEIYRKGVFRNRRLYSRTITDNQELPAFIAALTALGDKGSPASPGTEYGVITKTGTILRVILFIGAFILIALFLTTLPYDSVADFLMAGFLLGSFAFFVWFVDWKYSYCSKCRTVSDLCREIHIPISYRDRVLTAIRNEDHKTLKELPLIPSTESVVTLHLCYCNNCGNTARVTVYDVDKDSIGAVQDNDMINRQVTGQTAASLISLAYKANSLQYMSKNEPEPAEEDVPDKDWFFNGKDANAPSGKATSSPVAFILLAVFHVLLIVHLDKLILDPDKKFLIAVILFISIAFSVKTVKWRIICCPRCKCGKRELFTAPYDFRYKKTICAAIRNNDCKTLEEIPDNFYNPRIYDDPDEINLRIVFCPNCRDSVTVTITDIIFSSRDLIPPSGEEPITGMKVTGEMARTLIRLTERHNRLNSYHQE